MYSLGPFPAICKTPGRGRVFGEVYEVDEETLQQLDLLEGYPEFYDREEVEIVLLNDNTKKYTALVYIQDEEELKDFDLVANGEW